MVVKNREELSTTQLRRKALILAESGVKAVLPEKLMESAAGKIRRTVLRRGSGRVFVVGGGKAAGRMAESLEKILGSENITEGLVISKGGLPKTKKIKLRKGGHPFPSQEGVRAMKELLSLKNKHSINKKDLVVCLISGGGSSLMALPEKGITLGDKQKITKLLLESGAEIREINIVRKHLSGVKGGKLASRFSPARIISLIISDVVGNKLETIASGPTCPDSSTFSDAFNVLRKYNLLARTPKKIVEFLKKGIEGKVNETPKSLANCQNLVIGDIKLALASIFEKGKKLGLEPCVITSQQLGDCQRAALLRAGEIIKGKYKNYNLILLGGELTSKLPKIHGKGGRCQHYALASLVAMAKYPKPWVLVSLATDGADFLEEAAGAIVDNNSLKKANAKGLDAKDFLKRYDSYNFFKKLGNSLIATGLTSTNVADIAIYMLK